MKCYTVFENMDTGSGSASGFRVTQAKVVREEQQNRNPDPCCQLSNFISRPGHFPEPFGN